MYMLYMYKLWRKRIPMIALWCPAWLTVSYYVDYLVVLLKVSCRTLGIHCS